MLVVLDCNIWLSLALNKQLNFITDIIKNEAIEIATCDELQNEIISVALRPKFRKYFTPDYVQKLVNLHQLTTQTFKLSKINQVVSDDKDNYLFALCNAAKAKYFVTGDKLLLQIENYKQTQVISLADFKKILNYKTNL